MLHRFLSDLMILPFGSTCQDTTTENTSTPSDSTSLALSTAIARTPEAVRNLPSRVSAQEASQGHDGVAAEEQSTNDIELSPTLKSIQDTEPKHLIDFRDQINGAEGESVSIHESKKFSDSGSSSVVQMKEMTEDRKSFCDVSNVVENDGSLKIAQVTSGENIEDCAGTDSIGYQNKDSVQSLTTFYAEADTDVVGNEVEIETMIPAREDCSDGELHFEELHFECNPLWCKNIATAAEERSLAYRDKIEEEEEEDTDSECENISMGTEDTSSELVSISMGTEDKFSELVNISSGSEGNRSFELDHASVGAEEEEEAARDSLQNMEIAGCNTDQTLAAIDAMIEEYRDAFQTENFEDSEKPLDVLNSTISNHLETSVSNQFEEEPEAYEDVVEVNRYLTTSITDYLLNLEDYPGDEHRFPCFCKHPCMGKIAPQYKKDNRVLMWKSSNNLIDWDDFKARKTARF